MRSKAHMAQAPQPVPQHHHSDQNGPDDTGDFGDYSHSFWQQSRRKAWPQHRQPQQTTSQPRRARDINTRTPRQTSPTHRSQYNTYSNPMKGCNFCSEPGHNATTCRHGQPIECRDCGVLGHKAKYCPHQDINNYWGHAKEGSASNKSDEIKPLYPCNTWLHNNKDSSVIQDLKKTCVTHITSPDYDPVPSSHDAIQNPPTDVDDHPAVDNTSTEDNHDVVDDMHINELKSFKRQNMNNFICGHLNINSVRYKFPFIYDILSQELLDVFILAETKLDPSFPNSQFEIPSYNCHRNDRNNYGGGLMSYLRSDVPHCRRNDLEHDCDSIQQMTFECNMKGEKWFISAIYRPPNAGLATLECLFSKTYEMMLSESSNIIFIGDLNINAINENTLLSQLCITYDLKNMIKGPTCFKADPPTAIDVVLVSNPRRFKSSLNTTIGISDFHNLVAVASKQHKPVSKRERITYRSFKSFDDAAFNHNVDQAPFHVASIFDDFDDQCWFSNSLFNSIVDDHAPLKTKFVKHSAPFMNSELRRAQYKKYMLYNKQKKSKNKKDRELYRIQRNKTTSLYKKSIAVYFEKNCKDSNGSNFWKTIKPFFSHRNSSRAGKITLEEGGRIINILLRHPSRQDVWVS